MTTEAATLLKKELALAHRDTSWWFSRHCQCGESDERELGSVHGGGVDQALRRHVDAHVIQLCSLALMPCAIVCQMLFLDSLLSLFWA